MTVVRSVAHTAILAVGEGAAELNLLRHLKSIYLPRHCGTTVRIVGGLGKGGRGVLDYARGQATAGDYARVVLLLDTDVDWNDALRKEARQARFDVVESTPCLEAWLLAIHGDRRARSSAHPSRRSRRNSECLRMTSVCPCGTLAAPSSMHPGRRSTRWRPFSKRSTCLERGGHARPILTTRSSPHCCGAANAVTP